MADSLDVSIKKLVSKGKQRGYLTYEGMNDGLPDEAVSPDKLDALLMTLDELGIELIDEAEAERREPFASADTDETPVMGKASSKKARGELEV